MLTRTPPRVLTLCPPRVLIRCWAKILPNCYPYPSRTCFADMLFDRRNLLDPLNPTPWPSQPLWPLWPLWPSQPSRWLSVRFRREGASFAPLNHRPQCVRCPEPGCVRNGSGRLRPPLNEGSQFDWYLLIVVKNGIGIVVASRFITRCDKPVETID